jgi:hypothetical protein
MPTSKFRIGDTITVRLNGMEAEEIIIEGVVEDVREGNPPNRTSTELPPDPYCYRLQGHPHYFRESSIHEEVKEVSMAA